MDKAQLRTMLRGLRADRLMAASIAGSLDGLRDVIALSLTSSAPVSAALSAGTAPAAGVKAAADGPDALGNASADLVYTPVTPCRLFDTRASQGGAGTPALNIRRTYGAIVPVPNQGGPGGCAAPAGTAVALMVIGTLTPSGSGLLQAGPQGVASFPNALILYQAGDQYGTSVAIPLNVANGQFDLVEQSATADLYGDLLGYFRAPQGGFVASITAGNGIAITGSVTAPTVSVSTSISGAVALECQDETQTASISAGGRQFLSVACPAGFTVTGGGIDANSNDNQIMNASRPISNAWFTSLTNTGATRTYTFYARCCRVPAR